ncbi:hypothetical protein Cgig2_028422 [Carnegiea gigantea]|uniref:Uncharacterized protein n=1 Tax=Carnegiea gigantea TaxID=171969 RepID=A0A9Q1JIR0_9CARY|nr:hypothetical protein Cgig2_028422 [Carnegiea gigantea]
MKLFLPNRNSQISFPQAAIIYSLLTKNLCKVAKVGDCQVILDELGNAKGQRTKTFLAAFLLCCLCMFILSVRDTSCIRPGTLNAALFMASKMETSWVRARERETFGSTLGKEEEIKRKERELDAALGLRERRGRRRWARERKSKRAAGPTQREEERKRERKGKVRTPGPLPKPAAWSKRQIMEKGQAGPN